MTQLPSRRKFLGTAASAAAAPLLAAATSPPNILWLTWEDIGPHLHCSGDEYSTTPNFDRLADVAVMSRYHWRRVYQAMRGETPIATVRRLRLQRAALDLAQSSKPIAEIAVRAGYSCGPAFSRPFADAYGLRPAQYRERGSHADFAPQRSSDLHPHWAIEIRDLPEFPLLCVEHRGP